MIAQHTLQLRGRRVANGRPDPGPLGAILRRMKCLAVESVGMAFRGASRIPGRRPDWLKRVADIRFVGVSEGTDKATILHFQAPRFSDVAAEIFDEGMLFGIRPEPTDTAFDVLGDIIGDVTVKLRDSGRFDPDILACLGGFGEPVFEHGVEEIVFGGDRLSPTQPPRIDRSVSDIARGLLEETPEAVRARVFGRLDKIRADDQVFSLALEDGTQVRGIWLGQSATALEGFIGKEVVANGMVKFRPSGSPLRLEAEALALASPADRFFSKLPNPGKGALRRTRLFQPQTEFSGMRAVFGKWPGDETDEELLKALGEVE